jgi:hypothetical protein
LLPVGFYILLRVAHPYTTTMAPQTYEGQNSSSEVLLMPLFSVEDVSTSTGGGLPLPAFNFFGNKMPDSHHKFV